MEGETTEWKETWKDDYLRTLCAFANTRGGVMYVGVNDRGEAVPLRNVRKLLEDLPNKIRNRLGVHPRVYLGQAPLGGDCICIQIPEHIHAVDYEGHYYARSGSTTQELKGAEQEELILRKRGQTWDSVTMPGISVEELSEDAFDAFRRKSRRQEEPAEYLPVESREKILTNLRLMTHNGVLTRAAILLFHPEPDRFFFGASMRIGFFLPSAELLYQDEITGPLFKQVEQVEQLLFRKYLKAYISYQGFQRLETFIFPPIALREGILNAVIHKDYSSHQDIQIRVYDDKIRITNSGSIPPTWTQKDLFAEHSSIRRNILLAEAFRRARYIEAWGQGIGKICAACREAGIPGPEYVCNGDTTLILHAPTDFKEQMERAAQEKHEPQLSTRQKEIIHLLRKNPTMSVQKLAETLSVGRRTIMRDLSALSSCGLLRREGNKRQNRWVILHACPKEIDGGARH